MADIEAALRVALQQAALTGSAEPLVADAEAERRAPGARQPAAPRAGAPRRSRATSTASRPSSVADVATLSIKLDEAVRMVDELPLLSAAEPRRDWPRADAPAGAPSGARAPAAPASRAERRRRLAVARARARPGALRRRQHLGEIRSLVRVTRIDHPEAMLVAPEQAFFLRENLKLRLLNARLALLARQFDAAQADLQLGAGRDRSLLRSQLEAHRRSPSSCCARSTQQARQVGVAAARRHAGGAGRRRRGALGGDRRTASACA